MKCVVVGAGYAGLAAARTLLFEGVVDVKVVVLEAGSRVGGRAHTQQLVRLTSALLSLLQYPSTYHFYGYSSPRGS